jgi:hypothetical protein
MAATKRSNPAGELISRNARLPVEATRSVTRSLVNELTGPQNVYMVRQVDRCLTLQYERRLTIALMNVQGGRLINAPEPR